MGCSTVHCCIKVHLVKAEQQQEEQEEEEEERSILNSPHSDTRPTPLFSPIAGPDHDHDDGYNDSDDNNNRNDDDGDD